MNIIDKKIKTVLLIGAAAIAVDTIRALVGCEPASNTFDTIYDNVFDSDATCSSFSEEQEQ